jgi:hypothetical protein
MKTSMTITASLLDAVNKVHEDTVKQKEENIFYPLTEKEVAQLVELFDVDEKYIGFDKLEGKLKAKGVRDPKAVTAAIGMKKYGKKDFEKHAHEGKPLKESNTDSGITIKNNTATSNPVKNVKTKPTTTLTTPKVKPTNTGMSSTSNANKGITIKEAVEIIHEKFGLGTAIPGDYDNDIDVMFSHGIEKISESELIILEKNRKEYRDVYGKEKNSSNKDGSLFRRVKINANKKKMNEDVSTADKRVILAKTPSGKPIWRKIKDKQDIIPKEDPDNEDNLKESVHLILQIKEGTDISFKSGEKIVISEQEASNFISKYKNSSAIDRASLQKFACESYDNFKKSITDK